MSLVVTLLSGIMSDFPYFSEFLEQTGAPLTLGKGN